MRIGMLTSGGDCPGLNAVIRAAVRRAAADGVEVVGFEDAWQGVLERRWRVLDVEACRGILPRGGTILGTSRVSAAREPDGVARARDTADELGLDGFIVIGGDGSLAGARAMHEAGVPCIGVPKTIDNDVSVTDLSFGFDTAVQVASDAIDRLHSTAEASDRIMVIEVMGRHTGHIAVRAGLSGGAMAILVPEEPFDLDRVASAIMRRHAGGRNASIVVVAEGAISVTTLDTDAAAPIDQWGHRRLGGIAHLVGHELCERTGFEGRVTQLGYVQRGGTPTAFDRLLATRFGVAATEAAIRGEWGHITALRSDRIVAVSMSELSDSPRPVAADLLAMARYFAV